MRDGSSVGVVRAWQEAANVQDVEQLLALSDPEIELVGPRGSAYGHAVLRDWLARAGLTLQAQRVFVRGAEVVVAQHGVWRSLETGERVGEADIASHFQVRNGRVVRLARYDTLTEALAAAGLDERDGMNNVA